MALITLLALLLSARLGVRSFFYPKPPRLPPVVAQSTEELLARLQQVFEQRAPDFAQSLQPGISDTRIRELEEHGKFRLSPELQALYRWHNGMRTNGNAELIPMGYFLSLDRVVDECNALRAQLTAATPAQRAAYQTFAGHRNAWVPILPDGAGDGYFFDPERNSFFYHFGETGTYHWFPSFRNFLAAVIECYEKGVFFTTNSNNTIRLSEDSERLEKIWDRFGAGNQ